jgi:long-chain acyl-CoA synthetase
MVPPIHNVSIPALFREQAERFQSRPMLYAKVLGHWSPITWAQARARVDHLAAGLVKLGVRAGDRVSLLSENRPEWVLADLATLSVGAADAPIYPTNTAKESAYVVQDSGSAVCFVSTQVQLDKLASVSAAMPGCTHVVCFDDELVAPPGTTFQCLSLSQLEALGSDTEAKAEVDRRVAALGRDDLLTLIYTSGTTGEPKGVMLTHGNMLANCEACVRALPMTSDEVMCSFLPLSHSFERMAGYYLALLFAGATIYYAESVQKLVDNLGEVRPTVLCSVPRIYEKVYANFMAQRAAASPLKRRLIDYALEVGGAVSAERQKGREPSGLLALKYKVAFDLVFSKLHARLGGRLRFGVSGGAALSRDIALFFHAANILVLEGYGLSETAPVLTCNRPDAYRFGTVGRAIDNVELKIAADGEILARGPNVMRGYFDKPEATREVLLDDGWFATGDIGELDAQGFLKITDRKKDLFKTAGGKYIAPQMLENHLKVQRFIEQACVVGDQRPYCIAVLAPAFEALEAWAHAEGIAFTDRAALCAHPRVLAQLQAGVDAVNAHVARYEQVKYFVVAPTPFTQENGLLTPSIKVKRKAVIQAYASEIDAIYLRHQRVAE